MQQILIIEDEEVIRQAVSRFLGKQGYVIKEAGSVEQALQLDLSDFQLILSDIRLPGAAGTDILKHAGNTPVIIMTAYSSVQSAVTAMQSGAKDYIAKPFDHDELLLLVQRHIAEREFDDFAKDHPAETEHTPTLTRMIGSCETMQEISRRIEKIAPTDATVLILGESGTGKELVARSLHEQSQRSQAPFVVFNCAAVAQHAVETELFGNDPGTSIPQSGLIKNAEGGTLFLDEIGELPLEAQARLLRVLQNDSYSGSGEKQSGARIIAATHRNIRQLVQQNAFRSDLYFRMRVMEVVLPPLRERGDDIIELSMHLLEQTRQQLQRRDLNFTRHALEAIRRYPWPGNIRELANAIERAAILSEDQQITPELLAIDRPIVSTPVETGSLNEQMSLEEYFRCFVLEHQDQMTETELAKRLGISRKALWERRQRFGIPRSRK